MSSDISATNKTTIGEKVLLALVIVFAILLLVSYLYLIYKTWSVFGFCRIVLTSLLQFISTLFLGNLVGSRTENNGTILYNPKEWPKLLNIVLAGLIGYYLYTIIADPSVNPDDKIFGYAYLGLVTLIPILYNLYKLIRDRNDFVQFEGDTIRYKDNELSGHFDIKKITKSESSNGILTLYFQDESTHVIKLKEMNFNTIDISGVTNELEKRIPKTENEKI